jgi:outer membrane biosynthesis protein TonB
MDTVGGLILLAATIAFWVYLVKGVRAVMKKSGDGKRNFKRMGISFAASILGVMLVGIFSDTEAETASSTEKPAKQEEVKKEETPEEKVAREAKEKEAAEAKAKAEAEKKAEAEAEAKAKEEAEKKEAKAKEEAEKKAAAEKTFPFTWTQFANDWDNLEGMKDTAVASFINVNKTDQKDNIAIQAKLSEFAFIMADVQAKTDKVKYLSIMAEPSQDMTQNLDIVLAFGNLIALSNSSLTPDERGNILMEGLGFEGASFRSESYEFKGIKYEGQVIGGLLTISAQPSE